MYPTLSDFLREVLGINIPLPIQSYGFMFALAFIMATVIYAAEYKRKEKEGKFLSFYLIETIGAPATPMQLIWTFILTFALGFKGLEAILHYSEFVDNPQEMILSFRGNFLGGLILGVGSTVYFWWDKNRKKLPKPEVVRKETKPSQIVGNMLVFVGLWGLLGAKVFDAIQPDNFENFINNPIKELLSFSGLTFYGGLITGFAAGVYYLKKYNINLIQSIDALAPAAALGYGVGRIGCQVSGDGCWGVVNTSPKPSWLNFLPDWAWAYNYPHNVLGEGSVHVGCFHDKYCVALDQPVFPTPLYESFIMILAFFLLWSLRKRIKIPGILFSIYLILSGLERYFIEIIRVTKRYNIFGWELSQAQIISLLMVVGGIGMIVYMIFKKEKFIEWGTPKPKEINKAVIEVENPNNQNKKKK